jgi:hypothetical protein
MHVYCFVTNGKPRRVGANEGRVVFNSAHNREHTLSSRGQLDIWSHRAIPDVRDWLMITWFVSRIEGPTPISIECAKSASPLIIRQGLPVRFLVQLISGKKVQKKGPPGVRRAAA